MVSKPRLIILCGVPGAGKSTLAEHLRSRWGAVVFASENCAAELASGGRGPSGDLTVEAIEHAYSAMIGAASRFLLPGNLVVVVGSFRSERQRNGFRRIARILGAEVMTLRVACSAEMAAHRVHVRGESGPNIAKIKEIERALNSASDVEATVENETTKEDLQRSADVLLGFVGPDEGYSVLKGRSSRKEVEPAPLPDARHLS
jgi:predicted kinase